MPKLYLVQVRNVNGGPTCRSANFHLEGSPLQWAMFSCLEQGDAWIIRFRGENKAGRGPVKVGRIDMKETPTFRPHGLMPRPQDS